MNEEETRRLLDEMGGVEQIAREGEVFSRNHRSLDAMLPKLLSKHPNRWVAVYDGKVVGTSKRREWLRWRLCEKGINPDLAAIKQMKVDRRIHILLAA